MEALRFCLDISKDHVDKEDNLSVTAVRSRKGFFQFTLSENFGNAENTYKFLRELKAPVCRRNLRDMCTAFGIFKGTRISNHGAEKDDSLEVSTKALFRNSREYPEP